MPWAAAVMTISAYAASQKFADKESTIPDIKPGKHPTEGCGWKCTGCKATNGPETNKCIWCRTYRVGEAVESQYITQQQMNRTMSPPGPVEKRLRQAAFEQLRRFTTHSERGLLK